MILSRFGRFGLGVPKSRHFGYNFCATRYGQNSKISKKFGQFGARTQKFTVGVLKIREKWAAKNRVFQYCNRSVFSPPGPVDGPKMGSPESLQSKIFLYYTVLTYLGVKSVIGDQKQPLLDKYSPKTAFLQLYTLLFSFLLPNHIDDSNVLEHQKIYQKYWHSACLDNTKDSQAAAL